jgi:hypothetical protein
LLNTAAEAVMGKATIKHNSKMVIRRLMTFSPFCKR